MKRNVMISLEEFIHDEAKARGMNVSHICEEALKHRLESYNKNVLPENCKHDWTTPFCTPGGLVKECKICRTFKRVEVESHEATKARYNKIKEK